jgi:hypothetical protein
MHRSGHASALSLRALAPIGRGVEGPCGELRGNKIEDVTGQLPSGTRRGREFVGLRGLEIPFQATWDAAAVARPPVERHRHDAEDTVHAPPRAGCLPG